MPNPIQIVALAGSARRDSLNKKLVRIAADGARAAGARVEVVDLADYPMPLMDEDLELAQGQPPAAIALRRLLIDADGLLIASPEYNSSIPPLLKNAIDWVGRPGPGAPALAAFEGKVAGLLAASPGVLGGLRGLAALRSLLGYIGVIVLPDQYTLARAHEAFDADGHLKDVRQQAIVASLGASVARAAERLRG